MKQIGNYTYNQKFCLGQGAFGKVYEGSSNQGKKVAIKRIDKQIIESDPYLRSSIESQIQILKKFNHPNIVHLEDMVLTSNNIYIVTEFCNNGDLKQFLRNKKLTQQEALKILYQILSGFMEIVKLDVVHRDLKPANILVNDSTFKICDFGFAKYLKQVGKMNKTSVGTPMYMSPQVLKGKPYTNKTDIWSLGILTYQMLFGRTPWQGNSQQLLYKNIVSKPLQITHCSNFTYTLIKGMLEIQQSSRWSWNKIFQYCNLSSPQIPQQSISQQQFSNIQQIQQPHKHVNLRHNTLSNLKSLKNPRFCYFVLMQLQSTLILSPLLNQLKSSLFSYTISLYSQSKPIDNQSAKIIAQQVQQIKRFKIKSSYTHVTIEYIKQLCKAIINQGGNNEISAVLKLLI